MINTDDECLNHDLLQYNNVIMICKNLRISKKMVNDYFRLKSYQTDNHNQYNYLHNKNRIYNNRQNRFRKFVRYNRKKREDFSAETFRSQFPNEVKSSDASVKAAEVAARSARISANAAKEAYRAAEDAIDAAADNGILKLIWRNFSRFSEDLFNRLFKWQPRPNEKNTQEFIQNSVGQAYHQADLPRRY